LRGVYVDLSGTVQLLVDELDDGAADEIGDGAAQLVFDERLKRLPRPARPRQESLRPCRGS
jgi:hypothetical protein